MKSVDCIIVQRRMLCYDQKRRRAHEERKVVEITEVAGRQRLYPHEKGAGSGELIEKAAESFNLSQKEMAQEIERRKKLIMKAGPDHSDFFRDIQKDLFEGDDR